MTSLAIVVLAATPGGGGTNPGAGIDRIGSIVLFVILALFGVTLLVQWWMWLAGAGRFKASRPRDGDREPVARMFAGAFIKIVDDFRHFLALMLLAVFFLTLFLVVLIGWHRSAGDRTIEAVTDGIQLVVAALGGLVGSIVGYYYGESAVRRNAESPTSAVSTTITTGSTPVGAGAGATPGAPGQPPGIQAPVRPPGMN